MEIETIPAYWMVRANIINRVSDVLGDTWTLCLISTLLQRPQGFDTLVQRLRIPRSTLSARLRLLTEHGCLDRGSIETSERAYLLTPKGRDVLVLLRQMQQWNRSWQLSSLVLEESEPVPNPCGHHAELRLLCGHCGREADPRRMKVLQTHITPVVPPEPSPKRARVLRPDQLEAPLSAEQLMGDRWMGLILGAAFFRAHRFSEIAQALGIATNILTIRLNRLTQQGLLERSPGDATGEKHVYRLTPRGLSYYPVICAALAWGMRWIEPDYDPGWRVLHVDCLEWFEPRFVCATCGQPAM
ncbi:TPA: winged helix-turn-helix transcriptional regulator [Pseudomonas aeruginosa]